MSTQREEKAIEIGRRIVQARNELGGMRQEELAELVGVSQRSMQAYESGEVIPYRKMKDLERALGRPMAWLLHGDEAMEGRDEQLARIEQKLDALLAAMNHSTTASQDGGSS